MAWTNRFFRPRDVYALLIGFAAVQALAYALINRFMFHPVRGGYSNSRPGYVEIGTNGVRVAAIVTGPRRGRAAVVYCHGNAEDATAAHGRFASLEADGYTIAAVEYPGYGLSDGRANEPGCYRNAHRLYDWLVHERGFATNEIFVVGYSIGAGVAVELAASKPVAGLWLEAPYLSAPRIVTRIRLLAIDAFPSYSRIARINCPLLVMHGTDDGIIPYSQGKALYDLGNAPKAFVAVPAAGHTDLIKVFGECRYINLMRDFLSGGTNWRRVGDWGKRTPHGGAGGGAWHFPCHDANGNVTAYVDAGGAVVARYRYETPSATPSRARRRCFSGRRTRRADLPGRRGRPGGPCAGRPGNPPCVRRRGSM